MLVALIAAGGAAAAQQAPSPTPARSSRTAAITGVVSDGGTGKPVGGVTVTLGSCGLPEGASTVSDSKGRFVFMNLPGSTQCSITAAKPGYAGGAALRRFPFFPRQFPVADGEWIADANVVLWRLGGISGRILDEKGEPLVDVPVRVLMQIPVAGMVRWAGGPVVRTDDRGAYRIAGLTRGTYVVNVPSVLSSVPVDTPAGVIAGRAPTQFTAFSSPPAVAGFETHGSFFVLNRYAIPPSSSRLAYAIAYYPSATTLSNATAIELGDSEEKRNVDMSLRPVPAVSLSGRVTGAAATRDALVLRLLPEDADALGSGSEQATVLVGRDGTFVMPSVPAGRYILEASPTVAGFHAQSPLLPATPGRVGQLAFSISSSLPGDPLPVMLWTHTADSGGFSARLPVTVGSDDINNLELVLEPGASISGRVVREDGNPLPRPVGIRLDPANGDPGLLASWRSELATGADGSFSISALREGEYFLRAGSMVKSIVARGDYTNRPFQIGAGAEIRDVVVTLATTNSTLSGVVTDSTGALVREAAVILFPAERSLWTHFGISPPRIRSATYFGNQGYKIASIPGGDYFIIAVDPNQQDAWQDPRFLAAAAAVGTRFSLEWGATVVQNLTLRQVTVK